MNVVKLFVRLFGERGITILTGCAILVATIEILIGGATHVWLRNWG